jgi:hypothetical protein
MEADQPVAAAPDWLTVCVMSAARVLAPLSNSAPKKVAPNKRAWFRMGILILDVQVS